MVLTLTHDGSFAEAHCRLGNNYVAQGISARLESVVKMVTLPFPLLGILYASPSEVHPKGKERLVPSAESVQAG